MSTKLDETFHKALAVTKMRKTDCYILASDVMEMQARRFPLSRSGWTAAHIHAVRIKRVRHDGICDADLPDRGDTALPVSQGLVSDRRIGR